MFRKSALLWLLLAAAPAFAGQNVVVVLDDSGSMTEPMRSARGQVKIEVAKSALLAVLKRLPDDAQVGVLLLNGPPRRDRWVYPLGPKDPARLERAIRGITAGGATPLGERMKDGCDALLALREKQHYGSYRLVIVTDGEASNPDLVERFLPDVMSRGVWVDVIGVDMAQDHSLATRVHTYRKADNPADLEKALLEALSEVPDDRGGPSESDAELLAALPDEVAVAALKALSRPNNQPIGGRPGRGAGGPAVAPGGQVPVVPGQPGAPPAQPGRGGPGFLTWLVFILVIVGIYFMVRGASKPKRY